MTSSGDDGTTGRKSPAGPAVTEAGYVHTGESTKDTTDDGWSGSVFEDVGPNTGPHGVEEPCLRNIRPSERTEELEEPEEASPPLVLIAVGACVGTVAVFAVFTWGLGLL